VRWSGRQVVAALPGHCGRVNADRVGGELLAVIDRGAAVLIVDMTATLSCDRPAADALARVCRRAVASGTQLRLVAPAPAVRRVIARSGLDWQVPVFPALETAQDAQPPLAAVVPLRPRMASTGPAMPAPPEGAGMVTFLPSAGLTGTGGGGQAAREGMHRHAPEDALPRIASDIFHAGLTLQDALDQPADMLRRAAERVLELLDGTARDARTAAFAWHGHSGGGHASPGPAGAVARSAADAESGPVAAVGEDIVWRSRLRKWQAAQARARSQQARARAVALAAKAAATQERLAASLNQASASHPHCAAHLRVLSQAAASHAAQMRQWAYDHAATG
jgi:anti-anti-sigma regulatory factor